MKYFVALACILSACATAPKAKPKADPPMPVVPASLLPMLDFLGGPPAKVPEIECPPLGPCVPRYDFVDSVNDRSVTTLTQWLEKANANPRTSAILVVLDTGGGDVDAGWKAIKALEDSKIPVTCVADVVAASMGLAMLQACPQRYMTRRARLMAHDPSGGGLIGGGAEVFGNIEEDLRTLGRSLAEHVVARWTISVDQYLGTVSGGRDWWMNHHEALGLQAVDKVVPSVWSVQTDLNRGFQP